MFKNILVPLDGSELAEKILPQVEEIAKTNQAQVTLVTAGHFTAAPAYLGQETIKEAEASEKKVAEEYLGKKETELKEKGLKVNWTYKRGLAPYAIVAAAKDENADLIAMATHGGGDVAWSLGSVAAQVVSHAPVPVILLPVMPVETPKLKSEWFLGA